MAIGRTGFFVPDGKDLLDAKDAVLLAERHRIETQLATIAGLSVDAWRLAAPLTAAVIEGRPTDALKRLERYREEVRP